MLKKIITITFLWCLSCSGDASNAEIQSSSDQPNILFIIADDMGLDASPGYDVGTVKPSMPNIESLVAKGITFNNVWSYPTCTPTRASILTGKHSTETGVNKVGDELSLSETSIQKLIDTHTNNAYNHAVIGKWHVSKDESHPTDLGVGYYAGLLTGAVKSYWNWEFTENGTTTTSTEYTTTKFTDLAIDWVKDQSKPWFLWLAYNAPHTPFHLPPDGLHSQGNLASDQASIDANPLPYYMAMLEATDSEIGRLLASMSTEEKDNTIIIFLGDNGSPGQVVQTYNSLRAKGTIYQGGINVPLIISGKNVSRTRETEDALINTTDLFATIAEIAGTGIKEQNNSISFNHLLTDASASTRAITFSENGRSTSASDFSVRNATHKYILFSDGTEALFNLSTNLLEKPNLLSSTQLPLSEADNTHYTALKEELALINN